MRLFWLFFMTLLTVSNPVLAQKETESRESEKLKVAYFYSDSLVNNFILAQNELASLQAEIESIQEKFEQGMLEYQTWFSRMQTKAQSNMLTSFEIKIAEDSSAKWEAKLTAEETSSQDEIIKLQAQYKKSISVKIERVLARFSKKYNLDMLLSRSQYDLTYMNPKWDVTTELIEWVNKTKFRPNN